MRSSFATTTFLNSGYSCLSYSSIEIYKHAKKKKKYCLYVKERKRERE